LAPSRASISCSVTCPRSRSFLRTAITPAKIDPAVAAGAAGVIRWTFVAGRLIVYGSFDGTTLRTFLDGALLATAVMFLFLRSPTSVLVVGLSIWWAKMCPGGRNANAVTSQDLTDMGGGATFYDALVEVAPAESAAAPKPSDWDPCGRRR